LGYSGGIGGQHAYALVGVVKVELHVPDVKDDAAESQDADDFVSLFELAFVTLSTGQFVLCPLLIRQGLGSAEEGILREERV